MSETNIQLSDFRKNVNFAVLFIFGDNDFTLSMEEGAKLFCEQFNFALDMIDQNENYDISYKRYIEQFKALCEIENVKETIKCGFLSYEIKNNGKMIFGKMPNVESVLEEAKSNLDYIQWDGQLKKWRKVGDEYVVQGTHERFVTGTLEEISNVLNNYGSPYKNQSEDEKFPVWCNCESVILYMEDGYLTYVIR